MTREELITVFRSDSEIRLNLVQAQLQEAGVATMYRSLLVPWMDGVIRGPTGAIGEVVVRAEDADLARRILEDLAASLDWAGEKEAGELDDGDAAADPTEPAS